MKFKGLRFDSFLNPRSSRKIHGQKVEGRLLPVGTQWKPHDNMKSRLRRLRVMCKPILESKEPFDIESVQKAKDFFPPGNYSEYGVLQILSQAKEISEDNTEMQWAEAVDFIMDKLLDERAIAIKAAAEKIAIEMVEPTPEDPPKEEPIER